MYNVHKFMDLNVYQMTYFIEQVGLSASSFGVTADDVKTVATALEGAFNMRCAAPMAIIPAQGAQLQAICIDGDCPIVTINATCGSYEPVVVPGNSTSNMTMLAPGSFGTSTVAPSGSMTASMTMTGMSSSMMTGSMTSAPSSVSSAGAAIPAVAGVAALAGGFAALLI